MQVVPSTLNDIEQIFELYDAAIAYQKTVFNKHWQGFERSLIERELSEQRQWKILIDGQIACIFAIDFNDPLIWKEKDADPSIYLHRIVTNPKFRGANFVNEIVEWAKVFAAGKGKEYIRMDTWGDNPRLIAYYEKCGFSYLGNIIPTASSILPKHYEDIELALFEIPIEEKQSVEGK
ncbi:GNAT family N-acetyltransferase [Pedobacter steynii]|uniref:GNAT family N-acetyltransferase n=2 Tax=Pedobacter steynii TaxID=430522 RepID=A0A1D7QQH9_9SPHI|nr:GNAT family N-acetyltransferase [Pedobacter steynii]